MARKPGTTVMSSSTAQIEQALVVRRKATSSQVF